MSIEQSAAAERRRGRPRSTEKDDAILGAATRLFMERGFEAVSMDAIAEAAGVAKVTIYVRYPDKDALFRAVLAHKCEAIVAPALFENRGERTTREALEMLGMSFLQLMLDEDALAMHRIIMSEAMRAPRIAELFFESAVTRMCDQIASLFMRETAAGRLNLTEEEAPRLAWRFLGAIKGHPQMLAMMGMPQMSEADLRRHVRGCVDDLVRAHGTG